MVVRDEAARYLCCCLNWYRSIVDGTHVYDDQSMDDTVALARESGAVVSIRGDDVPAFMVHEGQFREAAWKAFEDALKPTEDDWVLAVDADEFLVAQRDERDGLFYNCEMAEADGVSALVVPIPEVFAATDTDGVLTRPMIRVDGLWSSTSGVRLFRYRPEGHFAPLPLACGSAPTYVLDQGIRAVGNMWLLHYGYVEPADRHTKHARYCDSDRHNLSHVRSILEEPLLRLWDGPTINVWKGEA